MKTVPVIVLGAGGHARVLLEALSLADVPVLGVACPEHAALGRSWLGQPVLGDDDAVLARPPGDVMLVNGVGSTRSVASRRALFLRFRERGYRFAQVIHPFSWVSPSASLAEGAQVMAGAVVQSGARIAENVLVNTRAVVEHDCEIGAHVHLASGCVLCGTVRIGAGTHVGAGATVIQNVRIGADCLVAAGAVVVRQAADGARLAGVPAGESS
jgi:sugar O-acyltransferase (sialic acid O-acetyltransferase NeuD family)